MNEKPVLIVIGGGAAGFFTAINAAQLCPELQVILLEKSAKLLQKVKISGGGRCNVTHACFERAKMIQHYPRGEKFLKKAFGQFFTTDTIAWFESRGVLLKTEDDGRMFPITNNSQTIIDCLQKEAAQLKIDIRLQQHVQKFEQTECGWNVLIGTDSQRLPPIILKANYLVIASGGFHRLDQFDWICNSSAHTVVPPVPSLFTFNAPANAITQLMGITVPNAIVKIEGLPYKIKGAVLFTHWGLSGPAILKMSAFGARDLSKKAYKYVVHINWLPEYDETSLRTMLLHYRQQHGTQKVANALWAKLPRRLWEFLLQTVEIKEDQRWSDLPAHLQNKLIQAITRFEVVCQGKTTFKDEFVTAGGIQLSEIDANSMMSKLHNNLFFAGEILDIDGVTGGFNFQNAWTTGYIAAKSIANKVQLQLR